jgi:Spy/CpxP family protein refolding chaperone
MNRFSRIFTRRRVLGLAGVLGVAVAALGLAGFRGPWHHRYDPARFDERMTDLKEHISEELNLTPAQQPQFDALMTRYRTLAKARAEAWHQTALDVQQAVQKDPADADAVAAALKAQLHQRPDPATVDRLIDDTVAFYRTLAPAQQEVVRKQIQRRLHWRLD